MVIDILCPLYNASKNFDMLVKGIKQQKDIDIKNIIFPVTESDDNTLELARSVPNAIVFEVLKEDFSHSLTREIAMKYATSDVVIFLSQDVYMCDEYAAKKLADSIKDNVVHAFSRQITQSKGIEKYIREKNYPDKSYIMSMQNIESEQIRAFYSSDACSAYDRKIFLKLGGYDSKKFQVSEEMYYCRKAILAGFSICYCAESVVAHSHNLTLKQLYKRYFDIGIFFAQNPEFKQYKSTNTGLNLAFYVLKKALINFDILTLIKWLPNMAIRFIAKKNGERYEISSL